jgi:hypothetical protein
MKLCDLLALILVTSILCDVISCYERRPTISFISQPEIIADIGDQIEMKCSVQYAEDFPVVWLKKSFSILFLSNIFWVFLLNMLYLKCEAAYQRVTV